MFEKWCHELNIQFEEYTVSLIQLAGRWLSNTAIARPLRFSISFQIHFDETDAVITNMAMPAMDSAATIREPAKTRQRGNHAEDVERIAALIELGMVPGLTHLNSKRRYEYYNLYGSYMI